MLVLCGSVVVINSSNVLTCIYKRDSKDAFNNKYHLPTTVAMQTANRMMRRMLLPFRLDPERSIFKIQANLYENENTLSAN